MKNLDVIAPALVIIGALNLGLAGLFHPDVVATLVGMRFGQTSAASIRRVRTGRVVRGVSGSHLEIHPAPLAHGLSAPARGVNVRWRYHFVRNVVKDMDIKPRLLMSVFALALTSINS